MTMAARKKRLIHMSEDFSAEDATASSSVDTATETSSSQEEITSTTPLLSTSFLADTSTPSESDSLGSDLEDESPDAEIDTVVRKARKVWNPQTNQYDHYPAEEVEATKVVPNRVMKRAFIRQIRKALVKRQRPKVEHRLYGDYHPKHIKNADKKWEWI